jgi:hypothetical protein
LNQLKQILCVLTLSVVACRPPERIALPDTNLARASDGRVAFIRATPNQLVSTSLGDEQATELWIADSDGTHARRLVSGVSSDSVEHTLASMSSPVFSIDGNRVYFLSRAWVTSDAVHAVDVSTGREWFVAPGNSLAVIPRGPFAGCLLVSQHRYRPNDEGAYDWTWLLSSSGKEITVAAADSAGADRRLETWMSGSVPADAFAGDRGLPANVHCNS